MKEIIYLDTKLVNSLLAQTNAGLVTKLINENSESDSNTESGSKTTTTSGSTGFAMGVKGEVSYSESDADSYSVVFSKSNKNLIESALDDYSLDVLLDSLEDKIKSENYNIGEIVLVCDTIQSYNFKSLIHGVELRGIASQLEGYAEFQENRAKFDKLKESEKHLDKHKLLSTKVESSGWNNFHNAKIMAEYMDSLFPNMTLIKIADTLSICENEMIRLNPAIMNFNNIGEREAKVLGIISSKFFEKVPEDFSKATQSDGLYRNAPSMFSNIILGSNDIIDKNDFVVRPIAIYFEN
ncbi:TPA: hypothetical protein TVG21_000424 [Streptococcus equi subsp. zooepidemicus]|nr:hypothetical protein [Streptococcus equi subsp. zooepidemicus]HEL1084250.1 hypothetical protein [Streptococcus equi subsp. zooepidemicus]